MIFITNTSSSRNSENFYLNKDRLKGDKSKWFRDELIVCGYIRECIGKIDFEWIDNLCHVYFNEHQNTTIALYGYKPGAFIKNTLQGELIYAASNNDNSDHINSNESKHRQLAIKVTEKELHNKGITIQDEKD